jgi:predicted membrane protein (TIGR00267 family)
VFKLSRNSWKQDKKLEKYLKKFRFYLRLTGVSAISRRYFVMNAFDGALTALGVIIGAWTSGPVEPRIIIGAGLGVSLAMGISGFSGTYFAERAERLRKLEELEKSLLMDLNNSVQVKAQRTAMIWAALVDALSPSLTALIAISPFIFAHYGLLSINEAVMTSLMLILLVLFMIGVYLGKISRERVIISGIRMMIVGIITAAIIILLGNM